MKKKIVSILMISALILSGCSGKGTVTNTTGSAGSNTKATAGTNAQASNDSNSSAATEARVEVKTDFKAVKPGTVPQLSAKQKTEVNTKVSTTVNDLSNTLKSIQDAQDIDLNSTN